MMRSANGERRHWPLTAGVGDLAPDRGIRRWPGCLERRDAAAEAEQVRRGCRQAFAGEQKGNRRPGTARDERGPRGTFDGR